MANIHLTFTGSPNVGRGIVRGAASNFKRVTLELAGKSANGTTYSLAAGVWSTDIGRVHRMAAGSRAGTVWISTYGYTDLRLRVSLQAAV